MRTDAIARVVVLLLAFGCADEQREGSDASTCDACVDARVVEDAAAPDATTEAGCELHAGEGITVAALLDELHRLDHLTRLSASRYTSHLASSHADEWYGGEDFVRLEPDETQVLLDIEGPGVITRLWAASPNGILRVELDGEDAPSIEESFSALLRGDVAPFGAPFSFVAAGGHNLYFPISFARSARVSLTGTGDRAPVYYQIGYRQYETGTDVERWSDGAIAAARCQRDAAEQSLRERGVRPGVDARVFALSSAEGSSASAVIDAPAGGGVLRSITFTPRPRDAATLRATVLVIEMDGGETVRVPLSDFFALGYGARSIESLPISADEQGRLQARWPMPFEHDARLWLERGLPDASTVEAELATSVQARRWDERSLYFHAQWRAPETLPTLPPHDRTLLAVEGEGFYVGSALNVMNPSSGWWGEGDERVFVDGELVPSHFGTGTEDHYGYAWCSNERFGTPYVGQSVSSTHQSFGYVSLYRFHIFDPIPFTTALRFDLEVQHWSEEAVELTYDSTAFFYARPGVTSEAPVPSADDYVLPRLEVLPPDDVSAGAYDCL